VFLVMRIDTGRTPLTMAKPEASAPMRRSASPAQDGYVFDAASRAAEDGAGNNEPAHVDVSADVGLVRELGLVVRPVRA
jgi:hypothetical protein